MQINMKTKEKVLFLLCIASATSIQCFAKNAVHPNIIVIFCDDLGYGDLSCYGSLWNQTPEVDQMALEGVRFTDFYAGAPVCTPSRAGLMTGCYARRVDLDLDSSNQWVLFPKAQKGINPEETILPEALKEAGYSTAIIGKWHLGDQPEFLPVRHGFDFWFGLPYSNDMGIDREKIPLLPLMQNEVLVEAVNENSKSEMSTFTKRYTEEAIRWIGKNKKKPFFLYLAHTMPHNPVAAREQFHLKTNNPKQAYGASVAEISWSTGEILKFLKREGLTKNTLVIFTSDNGGAPVFGASNGLLKGQKGQINEGGVRVPCIAWWPGKINPGTTCYAPASVLDFYSTFTALANLKMNDKVKRDGTDISDYLFNPEKKRVDRTYFYWHVGYLHAVRYCDWKLNLLGEFSEKERQNILNSTYKHTVFPDHAELYNLRSDPGETTDVADKFPGMVTQIRKMAEKEKSALGEYTTKGPEVRKTISVEFPKELVR
jgi:arylsulfatase A-like enzyme